MNKLLLRSGKHKDPSAKATHRSRCWLDIPTTCRRMQTMVRPAEDFRPPRLIVRIEENRRLMRSFEKVAGFMGQCGAYPPLRDCQIGLGQSAVYDHAGRTKRTEDRVAQDARRECTVREVKSNFFSIIRSMRVVDGTSRYRPTERSVSSHNCSMRVVDRYKRSVKGPFEPGFVFMISCVSGALEPKPTDLGDRSFSQAASEMRYQTLDRSRSGVLSRLPERECPISATL